VIDTPISDPAKRQEAFNTIETIRKRLRDFVGLELREEMTSEINSRLDSIAKLFDN